jgi:hypothetical protein
VQPDGAAKRDSEAVAAMPGKIIGNFDIGSPYSLNRIEIPVIQASGLSSSHCN